MVRSRLREILPEPGPITSSPLSIYTSGVELEQKRLDQARYEAECGPVTTRPLIEWRVPRTANGFPCCGLYKKRLSLNALALKLLGNPSRIRLGVMATGELVVRPAAEEDPAVYRVSCARGRAYVGGGGMARWLFEKGLERGTYRLERDEKLGVFVGRRLAS